jgi:hypothetical protein
MKIYQVCWELAGNIVVTLAFSGMIFLTCCYAKNVRGAAAETDKEFEGSIKKTDNVTAPPDSLNLDSFYKKYLDASGIPVISSAKVPDEALYAVQKTVNEMMSMRKDVLAKMIENKMRIAIMATSEVTKDMPEYKTLEEEEGSDRTWNDDRGTGATLDRPLSSCAEENVLCYGKGNDPYYREDILIHEFAHGIHALGIVFVDPGFDDELTRALEDAKSKGLWKKTYAISNISEYFAEGVQCWFDVNDEASPANGIHNEINTREELKKYDPALYDIIKRYFKEDNEIISCHPENSHTK